MPCLRPEGPREHSPGFTQGKRFYCVVPCKGTRILVTPRRNEITYDY